MDGMLPLLQNLCSSLVPTKVSHTSSDNFFQAASSSSQQARAHHLFGEGMYRPHGFRTVDTTGRFPGPSYTVRFPNNITDEERELQKKRESMLAPPPVLTRMSQSQKGESQNKGKGRASRIYKASHTRR
ncbi:hypothetical protein BD779DRAFT_1479329 [Infundibulicybe gibba]|nr:hypothetical protein BD779DRAFT_1479329 [Infundibulicybe gibba]